MNGLMKVGSGRFKQRGVSMVEMIIYVAIGLLIVMGGFFGQQIANGYFNTEALSSGVQTVRNGIVNLYASNKDYSTLNNGVLGSARITPSGVVAAGTGATTTLTGSWGGSMNVFGLAAANSTTPDTTPVAPYYGIQATAVPYDQCTKLVSQIGNMTAANWDTVNLTPGTGSNGVATVFTAATSPTINGGIASAACGSTGSVDLVFVGH